jgi:two-component system cell cycle response regulator
VSSDKTERTAVTVIERPPDSAINSKACLVLIYGGELGKRFTLEPPAGISIAGSTPMRTLNVGRSSGCEIQLDEESVSRKHASFLVHLDGRVVARDHGSTNGTYVNDRAIKGDFDLRDGDLVKIGRTIFKYLTSMNIEAQYHEEIYRLTTTDGLTGVYNKRYFLESLEREMGRCYRYQRPLCLVMIDIDHFKKINDEHGHLAGDTILKQVAVIIAAHVRREDIFARYGGEEFGLILPEVEGEGALVLAEKLRGLIEQAALQWDGKVIPVTISLGVSALPPENATPEEFIQAADECLYAAKHAGRNRAILAAPRAAAPVVPPADAEDIKPV